MLPLIISLNDPKLLSTTAEHWCPDTQNLVALLLPALQARLASLNPPLNVTMEAHYGEGAPDPTPAVCMSMRTIVLIASLSGWVVRPNAWAAL